MERGVLSKEERVWCRAARKPDGSLESPLCFHHCHKNGASSEGFPSKTSAHSLLDSGTQFGDKDKKFESLTNSTAWSVDLNYPLVVLINNIAIGQHSKRENEKYCIIIKGIWWLSEKLWLDGDKVYKASETHWGQSRKYENLSRKYLLRENLTRTFVSFLRFWRPNKKANMMFRITQTTKILVEKIPERK